MKALYELKDMLCKELNEVARKGELSAGSLETVHKLTDTVKNIDKIMMLEEGGGYNSDGYSGDGEWTARGNYGRNTYGGNASYGNYGGYHRGGYDNGYSGRHYVHGHYSRAEGQDMIAGQIREMMQNGDISGEERRILQNAMEILDAR